MSNLISRPYSNADDLQLMINLLIVVRPAERITDFPNAVDLQEALGNPNTQTNTRLWVTDRDKMVAFAYVDPYSNLRFEFTSDVREDVFTEMVSWGEDSIRREAEGVDESLTLDASCRNDAKDRIALFERHGFIQQPIQTLRMVRPLTEPIPEPNLPHSFRVRPTKGELEDQDWVDLHRSAFGSDRMTVDERMAMTRVPDYDPDLDLIVVTPGGDLVAYCMCSINHEENAKTGREEGYTDPLVTHPDYQRKGLARALLLTGLQLLKGRKMESARLSTSNRNIGMRKLAESVGFCVESQMLWFEKPLGNM